MAEDRDLARALQADGAQAVLGHHDAGRGAHHRVRRLAVARLVHAGAGWLHAKLALVALLVGYHLWCWQLLRDFAAERNRHSHVWFRWFNEFPVLVLFATVILVVFKPF